MGFREDGGLQEMVGDERFSCSAVNLLSGFCFVLDACVTDIQIHVIRRRVLVSAGTTPRKIVPVQQNASKIRHVILLCS